MSDARGTLFARLRSCEFVKSVVIAWTINFSISFTIAVLGTSKLDEIKFLHATPSWGLNLIMNAFYAGFFTPIFSCCKLKNLVRNGIVTPISAEELQGPFDLWASIVTFFCLSGLMVAVQKQACHGS